MNNTEQKAINSIKNILQKGKGIVIIIGNSFTGKTYFCNKILKTLGVEEVSIDYEEIKQLGMKKMITQFNQTNSTKIFGGITTKEIKQKIFFCDALESYSNHKSILTFLKNVEGPSLITTDKSIVISAHSLIEKIWWDGQRRRGIEWKGDKIETNPRDLYISMTSSKTSTENAIRSFEADTFILTQYLHEEILETNWIDLEGSVKSTNWFSEYDMLRLKDWEGNSMASITPVNNELLLRRIRYEKGENSLFPKRWFPSTLGKASQIQRNRDELSVNIRLTPSLPEILQMFVFKEGRGWYYKSKYILQYLFGSKSSPGIIRDRISVDNFRRVLILTGLTDLTETEAKGIMG
jgi:hypothetical protein